MKIIDLVPGSDEWKAFRERPNARNASEASIIMGCSKNTSRSELLRLKSTGNEKEFSQWVIEVLFARGHEVEELTRPAIEGEIGEELFPIVATTDDGYLSASLDGHASFGSQLSWECKQWNEAKAAEVLAGRIPEEDFWQVVQQAAVNDGHEAMYTVSDGDKKKVSTRYKLQDRHLKDLLAAWAQFDKDLADYVPEAPKAEFVGRAPDALPALRIEVTGMVTASNLEQFHSHALAVIGSINTELSTDEDFASAEKTVKWCKDVEDRLDAAKQHALSQTASIDDLFRTIDSIKEEARQTRLSLDKKVKARKDEVRIEIQQSGQKAITEHIDTINSTLDGYKLPDIRADFAGAMKGKKTITSLNDAVSDELARAKIEANQIADKMRLNIAKLRELASDWKHLFPDAKQLVMKDQDDMVSAIKARIADAEKAEEQRRQAEEQRRAAEELRKQQEAERAQKAPEPTVEPVAVKPTPAAEVKTKPVAKQRPSDDEIIAALSNAFNATRADVIGWIQSMNVEQSA